MINSTDLTRPKIAPEETAADATMSELVEMRMPVALPEVMPPNFKPKTVTTTLEPAGMSLCEMVKWNIPSNGAKIE